MIDIILAYYKKTMSFLLSILMVFAMTAIGSNPKADNPIKATQVDYSFDDDQILIGGYGYNTNFTDDEHLGYVKDAGIDFLISGANKTFLDACQRNGIGVIAKNYGGLPVYGWTNIDTTNNSPWLTFKAENYVDHPALWGNDLMDEPSAPAFPYLSKMLENYYSQTTGKFGLVNLYPMYANEEQLGNKADSYAFTDDFVEYNSYKKHINKYIETIDTDYISADIYPLRVKKGVNGKAENDVYAIWLLNLDVLAQACRETNRDLWLITQVTGAEYDGHTQTRIASETDIRWQAYTNLSFGAKAIIHACYQNGWWDENSHLVTRDGRRTLTYYSTQAVNHEIKKLSDVYMDYDNIGAYTVNGHKEAYTRYPLSKVDFDTVSKIKADAPLLVGCFEAKSGDSTAFTMVNMIETGKNQKADAKFQLKDAKTVVAYVKGVPTTLTADAEGYYNLSLASGEGVFVTVNK